MTQKTLALFFTWRISLKTWEKVGNLEREIKPYRDLAKNFKEIYFFTYGNRTDLQFQRMLPSNIRILPKKWPLPSVLYSLLLPFIYRKEFKKADVLKTNQMSGSWAAVTARRFYKKKLIVRCGYEWLNVLEKENKTLWKRLVVSWLEKIAYKAADKIIFSSKKDKAFAEKKFKIPAGKSAIIPNYIDANLFKPSLSESDSDRQKGIVYVGRLSKEKNLLNLVRAVGALQEHGQKVPLTLIGNGSLEGELRELAVKVGANVEFKGTIANENLPEELNKAKVFVLPSFYEGCPKALLEAMACGLCCVASDVEGINEVIQHKQNGYLTGTDSEEIKNSLQEALADNNLRQMLGQTARQTILQRFSLNNILNQEIILYSKLF